MSIDELAQGIGGSRETVQRAATEVMAMKTKAEELSANLAAMSAETMSQYMTEVAGQLDTAHQTLTGVADGLEQTQATAAGARQHGGGLLGGDNPGPAPPATPPRAIPGFTHRRPVGEAIDAIKREGWPKNADGRTSARGHLYDSEGRRIDAGTLKPHRKGQAPPCTDLKEPWRSDPDYTTTWHAERDAAKIMRDKGLTEAVLYLNMPACGRESRDAKRCDANLEKVLPQGSTLWVWSLQENNGTLRQRYEGTGEAIK